jgi:hypothetical protein
MQKTGKGRTFRQPMRADCEPGFCDPQLICPFVTVRHSRPRPKVPKSPGPSRFAPYSPHHHGSNPPVSSKPSSASCRPDDKYEQEADRVADQVMRSAEAPVIAPSTPPLALQRKCAACTSGHGPCVEGAGEESLQAKLSVARTTTRWNRKRTESPTMVLAARELPAFSGAQPRIQRFSGQTIGQVDAAPASVNRVLASPGTPLGPGLQDGHGASVRHDFSDVRVHSGTAAEQSAREVNAHAYTVGQGHCVWGGPVCAGNCAWETRAGPRVDTRRATKRRSGAK